MSSQHESSTRGRPTPVTEHPPFADTRPDYADAFEIGRSKSDKRSAEKWARDGFAKLRLSSRRSGMFAHRHLLGFRLGPWTSPDHIFGWRIVTSQPNVLHLEARGDLMDGHMIWRVEDERVVMTTFVRYKKRQMAALVWRIAGPIHRSSVPGLLWLAANRPA
jgi:hypothetical protein